MKRENWKKRPPLNRDVTGKEAVRKTFDSRKKYKQEGNCIITTSTQLTIMDGVGRLLLP